ncbi:BlaI/MecI/CopY family transcriptional regulator [Streptomyces olindensis]|uniref:BlaI/MecI/CopY family transcriptional regulator n=1 Tax=Streptomyces olindensis TaxID=358823 RepID=A0ABV2XSQ5_9ACTN|nr:CopY family transcriptional regulator [Streptomyces olindensis]
MRRLGNLEAEIMDRLWRWSRPAKVREIVDDINRTRPVAYTTVMTVADILHRKGFLRREKFGRAWLYEAEQSREDYAADLMKDTLGNVDDRRAALQRFVKRMSPEEVSALAEALHEAGHSPVDVEEREGPSQASSAATRIKSL